MIVEPVLHAQQSVAPAGRCLFLGEPAGWRQCPTCSGNVRLRVYDCRHPWHKTTTLKECRQCHEFQAADDLRQIHEWSVGVTTAPRSTPTLARCLVSLQAAGWEQPQIFAEPGVELPPD